MNKISRTAPAFLAALALAAVGSLTACQTSPGAEEPDAQGFSGGAAKGVSVDGTTSTGVGGGKGSGTN